jgi:hypothetical protein
VIDKPCGCPCQEQLARELLGDLWGPVGKQQIASGNADAPVLGPDKDLHLVGFSLTEDAAAVARVRLMEGQGSANDLELFDVQLSAGESTRELFGASPIPIPAGLALDRVSGSTRGTIYWRRRRRLT